MYCLFTFWLTCMSASLRSRTLTIFNLQVWFFDAFYIFYKSFPAEVWKILFTGTWPEFTLICRFLFWLKKIISLEELNLKEVFSVYYWPEWSLCLFITLIFYVIFIRPSPLIHFCRTHLPSLSEAVFIEKRGSRGSYAWADLIWYWTPLSSFLPQRWGRPIDVSPIIQKRNRESTVRGRGEGRGWDLTLCLRIDILCSIGPMP
jgi:hypothetical protein